MLEAEGGFFDTLAGRFSNGISKLGLILKGWCAHIPSRASPYLRELPDNIARARKAEPRTAIRTSPLSAPIFLRAGGSPRHAHLPET